MARGSADSILYGHTPPRVAKPVSDNWDRQQQEFIFNLEIGEHVEMRVDEALLRSMASSGEHNHKWIKGLSELLGDQQSCYVPVLIKKIIEEPGTTADVEPNDYFVVEDLGSHPNTDITPEYVGKNFLTVAGSLRSPQNVYLM